MLGTALQSSLCLFSLPGALSSFVLLCKCLYFPPLITPSLSPLPFPWVAPSVVAPSYKSHGKEFSRGASSHLVDLFPLLWMKGQCSIPPPRLCAAEAKLNCADSSASNKALDAPAMERCGVRGKGEIWGDRGGLGGDKLAAPAAGRVVAVAAHSGHPPAARGSLGMPTSSSPGAGNQPGRSHGAWRSGCPTVVQNCLQQPSLPYQGPAPVCLANFAAPSSVTSGGHGV